MLKARRPFRLRLEELEERLAPVTTLSIADASAIEPAPFRTGNMDFTVTRSGDLSVPLTVGYKTVPGTAQPILDFTSTSGTVTFVPGSTQATISIPIVGNGAYNNPSLTFSVELSDFGPQQTFATGISPRSVAVGDFNGDGKPDLVVANFASKTVSVLLNTTALGATTPSFAAQKTFATGSSPTSVAVGDFNGDGKPDLVVTNSGDKTVSVLLNTTPIGATTPAFATQKTFPTGDKPYCVAIADVNGDGKPDLVVANLYSDTVSVLLNTTAQGAPTPTFATQQVFATGRGPFSVAAGDVNGDGRADLVVANRDGDTVSVLLNATTMGATAPAFAAQKVYPTGSKPISVAISDVNGDGKADLVVDDSDSPSDPVAVFLNTTVASATTPTFASPQTFAVGGATRSVAVGDVNGDGKPDLVVTNASTVWVLLNTTPIGGTAFSFAIPKSFGTGTHPQSVLLSDFNGDNKPDLVVANASGGEANTVSVLLNAPWTFLRSTATGTISETDLPTVRFNNASETVNQNAGVFSLTVTLPTASTVAVTVPFTVSGTAVAGTDFSGITASPLVIPAGQSSGTITGKLLVHSSLNKTLKVTLGKPTNATLEASTSDTLTIIQPNTLSIGDARTTEPAPGGTVNMTFTVTRTGDAGALNVDYTTIAGTAVSGIDFTPQTGTTNFPAGSATASISVPIFGNGVYNNPSLTFSLELIDFTPGIQFLTAESPVVVAVADINGDGKLDLIVGNESEYAVSVLMNTMPTGASTPTFSTQTAFYSGASPRSVAVGDFNGDGKPDLVMSDFGSDKVSVLLNTTPTGAAVPSFTAAKSFAVGSQPSSVTVGDFNGDGKPDLVVANENSNTVSVLLNLTAAGGLTPAFAPQQTFATGKRPLSVVVGDFNGDGKPDLAVANYGGTTVSVLVNSTPHGATNAAFATGQDLVTGSRPQTVAVADFNGDGKPDLVVVNRNDTTVSVLFNTTALGATNPSFAAQQVFFSGTNPASVAVGDFNGDGKPDLVVANLGLVAGSLSVLLNETTTGASTAVFDRPHVFAPNGSPPFVAVGDFNGDGRPDLVGPDPSSNTVSVQLNAFATATGTITETDPPPKVSFASAAQTVSEGAGTFSATVTLSAASPVDTRVPFTLGGTAVSGKDYSGVSPSPLLIPAGQTSGTITGTLINDNKFGPLNKTLTITLDTPANATLGTITSDTLTIRESPPTPTIGDVTGLEGTTGLTPFTFRVSLPVSPSQPLTYDVFTTDGTAQAGVNYLKISAGVNNSHSLGTISFAAGQVSQVVTVYVIAGSIPVIAGTKTFTIHISDPAVPNASLAAATGTIIPQSSGSAGNGGGGPSPTIGNISGLEGTTGLTPFTFRVSLPASQTQPLTYNVFTTDGSALAGVNYVGITAGDTKPPFDIGTITFAPGQTSKTITVYVKAGSIPVSAGTKTFTINVSDSSNPMVALASATATIIPQDPLQ